MLEELSVPPDEEHPYRQLLSHPRVSVADLVAQQPQWSAERIEAVLRSLVELGLAVQTDQTGTAYAAISPDVAVAGPTRVRIEAARRAEDAGPERMAAFWRGRPAHPPDFVAVVTAAH